MIVNDINMGGVYYAHPVQSRVLFTILATVVIKSFLTDIGDWISGRVDSPIDPRAACRHHLRCRGQRSRRKRHSCVQTPETSSDWKLPQCPLRNLNLPRASARKLPRKCQLKVERVEMDVPLRS